MTKKILITENKLYEILSQIIRQVLVETSACLGVNYTSVRNLAHDVKAGDKDAIDKASLIMMNYVPVNSILIPIPSHTGKATYTLTLANFIAKRTKSRVLDILSCDAREMLYKQKMRGVDVGKINLGFRTNQSDEIGKLLHSVRNVILIDNVIDSGATYEQAKSVIKDVYGVDAWLLSLGAIENPKSKSYDVIRSIYPNRRNLYEENEQGSQE